MTVLSKARIKKFETIDLLQKYLDEQRSNHKTIGFVPTMGALHEGHAQLVRRAKSENDIVVSSVFVNPTQFNNAADLANYPRDIDNDIIVLDKENCDAVFVPTVEVIYPDGKNLLQLDLNNLDKVMEGKFRPGHFAGMITVVHRLFDIVKPHRAYFGEKDFQQLTIIKYMVEQLHISIEIIPCPTAREPDGLAMSSRNIHLTKDERRQASILFKTINDCSEKKQLFSPSELRQWVKNEIEESGIFKAEYIAFVNAVTLEELDNFSENVPQRVCIAVLTLKTRLIDNVKL